VWIEVSAVDARFWETARDSDDDEDAMLLALLRALRPTPSAAPAAHRNLHGATGGKAKLADDRYIIERQQALTLLTRRRVELRQWLDDGLGLAAKDLFPDKVERQVANAVLGHAPPDATPLAIALASAIDELEPSDE
jgi:hypothetical protein